MTSSMRRAIDLLVSRVGGDCAIPPLLPAAKRRKSRNKDVEITQLEERLYFSASPIVDPALSPDDIDLDGFAMQPEVVRIGDSKTVAQDQRDTQEVIFVDSSVDDTDLLVEEFRQSFGGRAQIYFLDATRDGVEQIGEILDDYDQLSAVHIVSHGSDSNIRLGATDLSSQALAGYSSDLTRWGDALHESADILLYGCDVASSVEGREFVESLSELTGADVAASSDITGHASLGGDFALEYATGTILTGTAFNEELQSLWHSTLAMEIVAGSEDAVHQAQPGHPVGNAQTTGFSSRANDNAVAISKDTGNYVVTYTSTGSDRDVFFQLFDPVGNAITSEVQLTGVGDQQSGNVVMDNAGNFFITWSSHDSDGSGSNIYAQFFNADGSSRTGILPVNEAIDGNNDTHAGDQRRPDIAVNDAGTHVTIVWDGEGIVSGAPDVQGVYGRTFDATNGTPKSDPFRVNVLTPSAGDHNAAVAVDDTGRSYIVWNDAGDIFGRPTIKARKFFDNGTPDGGEQLGYEQLTYTQVLPFPLPNVTVTVDVSASNPSVDVSGDGNIMLLGFDATLQLPDGLEEGAMIQAIDANTFNDAVDFDFSEGFPTENDSNGQKWTSVSFTDDETSAILTWQGAGDIAGQTDSAGVWARKFSLTTNPNDGNNPMVVPASGDILVNPTVAGTQSFASVSSNDDENFVIAWSGYGDADSNGVYVRRFGTGQAPFVINNFAGVFPENVNFDNQILQGSLEYNDADSSIPDLEFMLTALPSNGTLSADGTPLGIGDSFTQQQIYDGLLTYKWNGTTDGPDTFDFTVSDGDFSVPGSHTLFIGNTIDEGSTDNVLGTDIYVVSEDPISYRVEVTPNFGTLHLRDGLGNKTPLNVGDTFSQADYLGGLVVYDHDGSEFLYDSAQIVAVQSSGFEDYRDIDIWINPVNDPPTIDVNGGALGMDYATTFVENSAPIPVTDPGVSIVDVDSSHAQEVLIHFSGFVDGTSEVVTIDGTDYAADSYEGNTYSVKRTDGTDSPLAEIRSLVAGIRYVHGSDDPTPGTRTLSFRVRDAEGLLGPIAFSTIEVEARNDTPVAVNNGITVLEGSADNVIATAHLSENDPDDDGTELTYVISSNVTNGTLLLDTIPLDAAGPNNSFTQQDIIDGRLRYTHNGTETTSDSFDFSLADGGEDAAAVDLGSFLITVTPVNEEPVITSNGGGATATILIPENTPPTTTLTTVMSTDPDTGDNTPVYSIAGGDDATLFSIHPTTGVLTFATVPDFENPTDADLLNSYDVTVQVTDVGGLTDTQAIRVVITDVNEAPIPATMTQGRTEDQPLFSLNLVDLAVDPDGDVMALDSWSTTGDPPLGISVAGDVLTVDPAAHAFLLSGESRTIYFNYAITDYQNSPVPATITITITGVDDNPVINSDGGGTTASFNVPENTATTTVITTVSATDDDFGQVPTYSIAGGNDASAFTINPTSGELRFNVSPDFENPADIGPTDNSYQVIVQAIDADGNTDTQTLTIYVTDENEAPIAVGFTDSLSEDEPLAVYDLLASVTDPEGATLSVVSHSFTGDPELGIAVSGNDLTVNPNAHAFLLDGESRTIYVNYEVSDGFNPAVPSTATIMITGVDDSPVINSDGGGTTASFNVPENTATTTVITTVSATDDDFGQVPMYSIAGGNDASAFTINPTSGELRFNASPDFENPADISPTDNSYHVVVQAIDADGNTDTQTLTIYVTDENEAPIAVGFTDSLSEDEPLAVYDLLASVTDPEGATLSVVSHSFTGDPELGITVSGNDLTVNPNAHAFLLDGESRTIYVNYEVSDGFNPAVPSTATIMITGVDDNPVINSDGGGTTASFNVPENTTTTTVITTVSATDDDFGQVPTYSIAGGNDASAFTINPTSGELRFNASPDYENPADISPTDNSYQVIVQASDVDGNTDTQTLTINVTDQNEAPQAVGVIDSISEDQPTQTYDLLAGAYDPEGDPLSATFLGYSGDPALGFSTSGNILTINPNAHGFLDVGESRTVAVAYEITDSFNAPVPATALITITGANDAPDAIDVSTTAVMNSIYTFTSADFDFNDIDGDSFHSIRVATLPTTGTLRLNMTPVLSPILITESQISSGQFTFEPLANTFGANYTDFFFRRSDGDLEQVTDSRMTINVSESSNAPVAIDDVLGTTFKNQSKVISISDLLGNDYDPEASSPVLLDFSQPANGTLVDNGDGTLTYTPNANYLGGDSFVYTIGEEAFGLKHLWTLNGHGSDSINAADGTIYGASATSEQDYLSFDGVDDYVNLVDVTYANEFSISFRFRLDDLDGTNDRFVYSHGGVMSSETLSVFFRETGEAVAPGTLATIVGQGNTLLNVDAMPFVDGQWHTYTLTVDDSNLATVYVDGVEQAKASTVGVGDIAGDAVIGRRALTAQSFYEGDLSDVRIYDTVLSSAQLPTLHDASVSSATASINVISRPPVAVSDFAESIATESITIDAAQNDSDPDGTVDLSSYQVTAISLGANVTSNGDGTFDFVAANPGTYSFQYRFRDSDGVQSNFAVVSVTVTPNVTNSIWFSSASGVTGSGVSGQDSWTASEVLQFGDIMVNASPGLSDGNISSVFDLREFGGANVTALHYVSRDVKIAGFQLYAGDVLFAVGADSILTSQNVEAIEIGDVGLFRPDVRGDYSDGVFIELLDDVESGKIIQGLSLVEIDTVVGGRLLDAGSLLYAAEGDPSLNLFEPTSVGVSTTLGSTTKLLSGAGGQALDGIELIEERTRLGDSIVESGRILASIAADGVVGIAPGYVAAADEIVEIQVTSFGGAGSATTLGGNFMGAAGYNIDAVALNHDPLVQHTITGSVFHDVVGDGDISGDPTFGAVKVQLYRDTGDGIPGASDLLIKEYTDPDGSYEFAGLRDANYYVVVDSSSLTQPVPVGSTIIAEQTYGAAGSAYLDPSRNFAYTAAAGTHFGGVEYGVSDDATALDSSEHVIIVGIQDASESAIDFGFSYNVVTHVGDGGGSDAQGSLRQFIENANAIGGANIMRFVPAKATIDASGNFTLVHGNAPTEFVDATTAWWKLDVLSALPAITDANTVIDGTAYNGLDGTSVLNTNKGQIGYGGPVGVGADGVPDSGDEFMMQRVAAPELQITDGAGNPTGIHVLSDYVAIRHIAIRGFGGGSDDGNIVVGADSIEANKVVIQNNIIGAAPTSFEFDGVLGSDSHNIVVIGSDAGYVHNNLIGFAGGHGILLEQSTTETPDDWIIEDNLIRGNARTTPGFDGIDAQHGSGTKVVGNRIVFNRGSAVDTYQSTGDHTIEHNTILGNGVGGVETSGVRLFGDNSTVRFNQITESEGAGILVLGESTSYGTVLDGTAATGNSIRMNSFLSNKGNAIDLAAATTELEVLRKGDGISLNDGVAIGSSGNAGIDFPELTMAQLRDGVLSVTGTTAPNVEVEVYLAYSADGDSLGSDTYGEGAYYLGTATSGADGTFKLVLSSLPAVVTADSSITTIAINGLGNTSEFSRTMDINAVPVAVDDKYTVIEDTMYSDSVATNDSDLDGDSLTYSVVETTTSGVLQLKGDGSFDYTPNPGYHGFDSFRYRVVDGNGGVRFANVSITVQSVEDAPIALDDSFITSEDVSIPGSVATNDSDQDGDPLTYGVVAGPTNGSLDFKDDGSFEYTPNLHFNGTDTFTYELSDGNGGVATATVTINVTPVNDAPVGQQDSYSIDEDTTLNATVSVLSNDFDVDQDALSAALISTTSNGSLVLNSDGTFVYTPGPEFFGNDSFVYEVADGNGGKSTVTVEIEVFHVNDVPTVVAPVEGNFVEDNASATVSLLAGAADLDGDALAAANVIVISGNDAGITIGPNVLTVDPGRYELQAGQVETVVFEYDVEDGNGGAQRQTATIRITGINDAPVANNDLFTVNEGEAIAFNASDLLSNDADPEALDLIVDLISGTSHGTLSFDGSAFTYVHDGSETTQDSAVYQITDSSGVIRTATIGFDVAPVNDLPIANDDAIAVREGQSRSGSVTNNDFDAERSTLLSNVLTGPSHGQLVLNSDGTFTYVHDGSENFVDSFVYEVEDGSGGIDTATVNIQVEEVNDEPVAEPDRFETVGELVVDSPLDGVLSNDSDSDDTELTARVIREPANGRLEFNPDGSFTYVPTQGFSGTDSFVYELADASGGRNSTEVRIDVRAIPVPVVVDNTIDPEPEPEPELEPDTEPTDTESETNDSDLLLDALTGVDPQSQDKEADNEDKKQQLGLEPTVVELEFKQQDRVAKETPTIEDESKQMLFASTTENITRTEESSEKASESEVADSAEPRQHVNRSVAAIKSVLTDRGVLDNLDSMRDDLELAMNVPELAGTSLVAATSTFTVGYVAWVFRAGYLLASVLSAVPSWQAIDPMPIMSYLDDEEGDDSDGNGSIESLMTNSQKPKNKPNVEVEPDEN